MSDPIRPRGRREHWASDHERARQRAAERLSLPLPATENGWLDRHLRMCAACASVATDYARQQADLRGLEGPVPPRDLWARTSASLDRAERNSPRDLPNPSVFPGRRGVPGSRGSRSIRGMRAEQRASAFRAGGRPIPAWLAVEGRSRDRRSTGITWLAPFGALAALAIVIVVGGNALLTGTTLVPVLSPAPSGVAGATADASGIPIATAINVGAGEVAWLTPAEDGTYSLNLASVDKVCPTGAKVDCAPIAGSAPRNLPTVNSRLHTVIRDPAHRQLVVVPTSSKRNSGGSVIVVAVPTPAASSPASSPEPPATRVAPASASASDAPTVAPPSDTTVQPLTTDVAPSPSDSSPTPGVVPPSPAVGSTVPSSTAATAGSSAPSPTSAGTPTPTEAAPAASGGEASPAPDSPTPSASVVPTQPEPTATALAIISDAVIIGETASWSPDGTMLAFSARPADASHGPDIYLWRPGDATAHPITTDHASVFSGWLNNQLLGSQAIDAAGGPAPSDTPSADGNPSPSPSDDGSASPSESATPTPSGSVQGATSSDAPDSANPSTSADPQSTDAGVAPPSASDSATDGTAVVASAATPAVALVHRTTHTRIRADVPGASAVTARSFILDPVSGAQTDLAAPAWRPVVDPTGRFVAYWAGSLRYDDVALSWVPDRGALVLASWPALRGSDPTNGLAPLPLLGNSAATVPPSDWDIRWDETGSHVAVWAADADNPELGRLTLLTIDPSGRVDPSGVSLHDAPALAGFSMGGDRLAWATPPGQDGEGSRLQVLAWSGENAGNIDSQPVSGGDPVVVVR